MSGSDWPLVPTGCWLFRKGLIGIPVGLARVGYLRKRSPRGHWQACPSNWVVHTPPTRFKQQHADATPALLAGEVVPADCGPEQAGVLPVS